MIIVDKAQAPYDDARFWASFVKSVVDARFGPMIALFGSYESPFAGSAKKKLPQWASNNGYILAPSSGITYSFPSF